MIRGFERETAGTRTAIIAVSMLAGLPQFLDQSIPVMMGLALCWGYSIMVHTGWLSLPGSRVRHAMVLVIAGMLYFLPIDRLSGEGSIQLLLFMAGLKLMELSDYRNRMIMVLLCYFLGVTGLFVTDSIFMTLYVLGSLVATTTVLVHLNAVTPLWRRHWKIATIILLQALPLALLLFFLFPRYHGYQWSGWKSKKAQSGLSDMLKPGSVSGLALNRDIAFRADFKGKMPRERDLYWRVRVLTRFDGETWRPMERPRRLFRTVETSGSISYEITLEPHNGVWLVSLDHPVEIEGRSWIMNDFSIQSYFPIRKRTTYSVRSITGSVEDVSGIIGSQYLELPSAGNQQARMLAEEWQDQSENPQEIIAHALRYFRDNGFQYSLEPPPLGADRVDDFLFRTKTGYCEHYASSFAFLLRAAGIRARIVGGYFGGEYNPYGEYLIVRQSEAHAWVEAWLPDQAWVRYDPSMMLAPQRFTLRTLEQGQVGESGASFFERQLRFLPLRALQLRVDALNIFWHKWFIGYTASLQDDVFQLIRFTVKSWGKRFLGLMTALLVLAMTGIILYWFIQRIRRDQNDEIIMLYSLFCRKLEKIGIVRSPSLGPSDFMDYIAEQRPDLSDETREILTLYIKLRYGVHHDQEDRKKLGQCIKQFRPGKSSDLGNQ